MLSLSPLYACTSYDVSGLNIEAGLGTAYYAVGQALLSAVTTLNAPQKGMQECCALLSNKHGERQVTPVNAYMECGRLGANARDTHAKLHMNCPCTAVVIPAEMWRNIPLQTCCNWGSIAHKETNY